MLKVNKIVVKTDTGKVLLSDISLTLKVGEKAGLTGSSGSGKSTLLKTILGMPDSNSVILSGTVSIDGHSLYSLQSGERRKLCGKTLGYIPQNPMTAFDPRMKIGKQIHETMRLHLGMKSCETHAYMARKFVELHMKDPDRILNSYPSQLSGGMLQRVCVSLVLGLKPRFILADEPTSALDEENAEILVSALSGMSRTSGLLFISHDIKALSALCPVVSVLEEGRIIEQSSMESILDQPRNAWTESFASLSRDSSSEGFTWQA